MIDVTHVLCPIDFSEGSSRALAHAAALARWYEARLTALHVWASVPAVDIIPSLQPPASSRASLAGPGRAELDDEMRRFCAGAAGHVPVAAMILESPDIEPEILAQVGRLHADLLVIGSHGRSGFEQWLLGSVTEQVVRKAPCPVMVVPAHDATPPGGVRFRRIVCPVDFSESAAAALQFAFSLAEESDGWLCLLHVLEIPPELREGPAREGVDVPRVRAAAEAAALTRLRALVPGDVRAYCTVETAVLEGRADREILATSAGRHADLIVMGVSGHGAVDRWVFGSNTSSVIRGATCPVLIVRH